MYFHENVCAFCGKEYTKLAAQCATFGATAKVVLCEFHETFMTYYKTTTTTTASPHRRATKLNRSKKQPKPTTRHPLKDTFRPIVPQLPLRPLFYAGKCPSAVHKSRKKRRANLSCGYFWAGE